MRPLFFILFLVFFGVTAQSPYHVKYGVNEGLPTSNIYSVFEDSSGYMWFGTDVGVLKFDGYNFEHFSTDDGLSDNEVFKFYEDSKHRIWFITLNGKLSFYKDGVFNNYKNDKFLNGASNSKMITDVFEFSDFIYVLYRDGQIIKLNTELDSFLSDFVESPIFGHWIGKGEIFYLTIENIINQSKTIIHSIKDKRNSSLGYRAITHNDQFVFSIKGKLYTFNATEVEEFLTLENEDIIHLSSIDKSLFIGTRSGLYIKSPHVLKKYFPDDIVSFVKKDSQDNYWVTTLNDGIKFIPNFNIHEYKIGTNKIKVNALKKSDNDDLWIGTENGLYVLNANSSEEKNTINSVTKNNYINKVRYYEGSIFSVGNDRISIINNTSVNTLNFGANDFYFNGTDYLLSSSVVFKFDPLDLSNFPKIRNENTINSKTLNKYALLRKRTNVIAEYKQNSVFLGTSLGLFCSNKDSVYQIGKDSEELNSSILDVFYNAIKDEVVVATNSTGVSILKENDIKFHFSKQDQLSSNTCYSIKPYQNGYLVGTNTGLDFISYDDQEKSIKNLIVTYGLKNEKINDIEVVDSTLYLGTDQGLIAFKSNAIKDKTSAPILDINTLLINGEISRNLDNLESYQNNLSLGFTGISYADYGQLYYEYRINKQPWASIYNRNLEIKNLSFGHHNIELRAKGQSGNWSAIKHVDLFINKPFWRSIPFLFFVSLFVAFLVYIVVGKRIKSMQQRFNKERKLLKEQQDKVVLEKQMAELEQKALRLQMNPHFIFNALNTIKGYYSGGSISEANQYISRFSKLLRLILESDQSLISIEKEVEMLELYIKLIRLRYQDIFDYNIEVSETLKTDEYAIPPLLLQPIVENSIIHGLAPNEDVKGKLKIEFKTDNENLVCKVIDNGIGILRSKAQKTKVHKSKAIQITRERIYMINESESPDNFKIEELSNPSGTIITIRLPLIKLW